MWRRRRYQRCSLLQGSLAAQCTLQLLHPLQELNSQNPPNLPSRGIIPGTNHIPERVQMEAVKTSSQRCRWTFEHLSQSGGHRSEWLEAGSSHTDGIEMLWDTRRDPYEKLQLRHCGPAPVCLSEDAIRRGYHAIIMTQLRNKVFYVHLLLVDFTSVFTTMILLDCYSQTELHPVLLNCPPESPQYERPMESDEYHEYFSGDE